MVEISEVTAHKLLFYEAHSLVLHWYSTLRMGVQSKILVDMDLASAAVYPSFINEFISFKNEKYNCSGSLNHCKVKL